MIKDSQKNSIGWVLIHEKGICNVKNLRKKPVVRLRDRIRLRKEKGLWTGTQHLNSSFNIISKP